MAHEIILLPANGGLFEETIEKHGYREIENETKYPMLTFLKKGEEYFQAPLRMWENDNLRVIKLTGKPDQTFTPFLKE